MVANSDPDRLMTIDELADRWQVSTRTVKRIAKGGELRLTRIGRQLRARVEDAVSYERAKRQ